MSVIDDFNKTFAYLRRNGIRETIDAAAERLSERRIPYTYDTVPKEEIARQAAHFASRRDAGGALMKFSILTPVYHTPEPFLREMLDSVRRQTYGNFEHVLAVTPDDEERLRRAVTEVCGTDERFVIVPVAENLGIAENTNAALDAATGDYIGLLDHDDLLTVDALFMVEQAIRDHDMSSLDVKPVALIYSDEDKCDEKIRHFFELHRKYEFNPDLLFSNNYLCHFTVIDKALLKYTRFRKEYDGAQDYDVFLRTGAHSVMRGDGDVLHVPRVLYHWRTHSASSAGSSVAKGYAYEAGRRAVKDFLFSNGIEAEINELAHVGFHRVEYLPDLFTARKDVGVVGGKIVNTAGTITGGMMTEDGHVYFEGMPRGYSGGYQHVAALQQQAKALDLRCMQVREELSELYTAYLSQAHAQAEAAVIGFIDEERNRTARNDAYRENSLLFSQAVREQGYVLLWDPQVEEVL